MSKIIRLLGFFVVFICSNMVANAQNVWTTLYKKRFTSSEVRKNGKLQKLLFEKRSISPFSQLVFSWNAFRPQNGAFSFFVKVRNAKTKKWSGWYKMADWGKKIQRSYAGKSKGSTSYIYVRLETGRNNLADSFSIKILPTKQASLDKLKGFAVCATNFKKFKREKNNAALLSLPSVYIKNVPRKSQMILDRSSGAASFEFRTKKFYWL